MKLNNGLRNWINRCKEYAKANGCSYKVAMSKLGKKGTRRGSLRGGGVADHAEAFTPLADGNPHPASPPASPPPPATAGMDGKDPFTVGALPQAQTGGGLGMFEVGGAPQSLTGGRRRRRHRQQTGGRKKRGSKKRGSKKRGSRRSRSRSHRGGSGSSSSLSYSDYS